MSPVPTTLNQIETILIGTHIKTGKILNILLIISSTKVMSGLLSPAEAHITDMEELIIITTKEPGVTCLNMTMEMTMDIIKLSMFYWILVSVM